MMARQEFETAGTVELRDWADLDRASWWCEKQWRDEKHGYRRMVRAGDREATFEFADADDAFIFKMTFG